MRRTRHVHTTSCALPPTPVRRPLQVVLPMLYNDVVGAQGERAWMTSEQFYAGLALAQAMPGPLFNFSAYLGEQLEVTLGCVGSMTGVPGLRILQCTSLCRS